MAEPQLRAEQVVTTNQVTNYSIDGVPVFSDLTMLNQKRYDVEVDPSTLDPDKLAQEVLTAQRISREAWLNANIDRYIFRGLGAMCLAAGVGFACVGDFATAGIFSGAGVAAGAGGELQYRTDSNKFDRNNAAKAANRLQLLKGLMASTIKKEPAA